MSRVCGDTRGRLRPTRTWIAGAVLTAIAVSAPNVGGATAADDSSVVRASQVRVVVADGSTVPGVTIAVPRLAANDVPSPWFLGAGTLDAASTLTLPEWAWTGRSPIELLYVRGGGFPFFGVATPDLRPARLESEPGRPLPWEVGPDVSVRRPRADLVSSRSETGVNWTLRWKDDVAFVRAVACGPDGAPARAVRIIDLDSWEPYRDSGDGSFAIVRPKGDTAPLAVTAEGLPTTYVDREAIFAAANVRGAPLVVGLRSGKSIRMRVKLPSVPSAAAAGAVTVWIWDTRHPVLQRSVTLPTDGDLGPLGPDPVEIAAQTTGPDGATLLGRVTATPGCDPIEIELRPSAWRYADAANDAPGVRIDDGTIGGEQPGAAAWSLVNTDGTGGRLQFPTWVGRALRVRPGRYEIRRTRDGGGGDSGDGNGNASAQRFPCEARDGVDVVFAPPRARSGR